MTNTTAPAFRYIGVTDECVTCEKCGKPNLRSTVVLAILDADGNTDDVTYYGSTCAARALTEIDGKRRTGTAVLQSARWAAEKLGREATDCREVLARYGLDGAQPFAWKTFRDAAKMFRWNNCGGRFAETATWQDWQDETYAMVARRTAIIREAERFGL
jgi:hypothetical protein